MPGGPARTSPAEVAVLRTEKAGTKGRTYLRVVLREGRKRQIRRTAALLGHPVVRLIRVRICPVRLDDLPSDKWRYLSPAEIQALQSTNC